MENENDYDVNFIYSTRFSSPSRGKKTFDCYCNWLEKDQWDEYLKY